MELSKKQQAELRRLARVFTKMEAMTAGIEAESVADFAIPKVRNVKNSLLEIAFKRRNAVLESILPAEKEKLSSHFTVIVNEDRF